MIESNKRIRSFLDIAFPVIGVSLVFFAMYKQNFLPEFLKDPAPKTQTHREKCIENFVYLQTSNGATAKLDAEGRPVACQNTK